MKVTVVTEPITHIELDRQELITLRIILDRYKQKHLKDVFDTKDPHIIFIIKFLAET